MKIPISAFVLASLASVAVAADFTVADLTGKQLALVDQNKIEVYRLTEGGRGAGEFGTKDGAVAGPVFRWRIAQGILFIENQNSVHQKFTLVERKDDKISVRRQSGELATFQISPLKK